MSSFKFSRAGLTFVPTDSGVPSRYPSRYNESPHTFETWGLYLLERPIISVPVPKYQYIDQPQGNGSFDATGLYGSKEVFYERRTITAKFQVLNHLEEWDFLYERILNFLQGKEFYIFCDPVTDFFWRGRAAIDEWDCDRNAGTLTIVCNVAPYKTSVKYKEYNASGSGTTEVTVSVKNESSCRCTPYFYITGASSSNPLKITRTNNTNLTDNFPKSGASPAVYIPANNSTTLKMSLTSSGSWTVKFYMWKEVL